MPLRGLWKCWITCTSPRRLLASGRWSVRVWICHRVEGWCCCNWDIEGMRQLSILVINDKLEKREISSDWQEGRSQYLGNSCYLTIFGITRGCATKFTLFPSKPGRQTWRAKANGNFFEGKLRVPDTWLPTPSHSTIRHAWWCACQFSMERSKFPLSVTSLFAFYYPYVVPFWLRLLTILIEPKNVFLAPEIVANLEGP